MPRFLISFDDGSMDHIPRGDLEAVGKAARAVARDAKEAGVWIFGCGLHKQQAVIVSPDGTKTDGPFPETKAVLGGLVLIEVTSKQEAIIWAERFANACRCKQEVREILYDPES